MQNQISKITILPKQTKTNDHISTAKDTLKLNLTTKLLSLRLYENAIYNTEGNKLSKERDVYTVDRQEVLNLINTTIDETIDQLLKDKILLTYME